MDEENRLVPAGLTALAPVAIDELATKVVAAIDLIAAIIPDLRTPHPATARRAAARGPFRARPCSRSWPWSNRRVCCSR